jgi:esterase/lipase superfamily enzyme
MNEFYHKFYSQYLQRDFEMLVFGHAGYPVILFPGAGGRYYEMKDRNVIEYLSGSIEAGKIKIFCPDTIDYESWYNYDIDPESRINRYLQYQQTILKDVIEFAMYEMNTSKVGLAGFEFGAYHSANITFRFPNMISSLYCLGGTYDIRKHIMGFYNDDCFYNNPRDYLPGLTDKWHLEHLKKTDIRICIGSDDQYLDENLFLSELMGSKEIDHLVDSYFSGGENFKFYKSKLSSYLG